MFVDTCDECTTGRTRDGGLHRGDASEAIARALKCDILLVRDDWDDGCPPSFKDALVAPLATVEALLNQWNASEVCLATGGMKPRT